MNINDVKKIAVLGSGAMGHGIAQVCIQAGCTRSLCGTSSRNSSITAWRKSRKALISWSAREKWQAADKDKAMSLLTTTLDTKEAVADAQIVIEAVPEIMDLKKTVFKEVSDACKADCHPGDQYLHHEHIRNRQRGEKPRALCGPALLQPGQPDEACGSHLRRQNQ